MASRTSVMAGTIDTVTCLTSTMVEGASPDPPLACLPHVLDKAERQRQQELLESVHAVRVETRELPNGFAFRLPAEAQVFRDAAEWVSLERRCCPFLEFSLEWRRDDTVWVHLTGGPGVKDFLRAELDVPSRANSR